MRVFIVIIFLVMTKFWCRPRHIFIFLQICGCVLWPVLFLISELRCVIDQLLFLVDFSNVSQQGFTLFQCSVVALGVFMSSQISEKPSQVFFFFSSWFSQYFLQIWVSMSHGRVYYFHNIFFNFTSQGLLVQSSTPTNPLVQDFVKREGIGVKMQVSLSCDNYHPLLVFHNICNLIIKVNSPLPMNFGDFFHSILPLYTWLSGEW